jgi:hypothetical protein
MGAGLGEILILILISMLPLVVMAMSGWALWKEYKRRNRNHGRIDRIESCLERIEQKLDRLSERTAAKQRD